jgi:hypothetical protein
VYAFNRNEGGAGTWGQSAKVTPSDAVDGDGSNFGFRVDLDGDVLATGTYVKNSSAYADNDCPIVNSRPVRGCGLSPASSSRLTTYVVVTSW